MADGGNSPVERRDILKIAGGAPFVLAPGVALKAEAQDSGTFEISNVVVEIDGSEQSKDDVVANQGQQGTVSADITNTGSETGVADVFLALEGVKAETGDNPQTVELGPDETERVSFTGDTGLVPPGDYSGSLQTEGDTVTGNLTVLPVTEFEVRNPQPENKELTVEQGEEVTVSADIVNVGDGGPVASGVELILRKEGESEFNVVDFGTTAKLNPGEADRVEFTGDTSELDPGTYEGGIRASPNDSGDRDSITGTLEVIESGGSGGNADLGLNSIESGSLRELDNLVSGEEVIIKLVTDDGVDLSEELGGPGDKIEWDFGDGTVDTITSGFGRAAQSRRHTYEESGAFDITVTVTNFKDFGQTELTDSVSERSVVFPEGYEKQKEDKLTLAGEIDEISARLNEKERAEEVIASVEDSFSAQELGGQEAKDAVRRLTLGEQVTETTIGSVAPTDDGRPDFADTVTEGMVSLVIIEIVDSLVSSVNPLPVLSPRAREAATEIYDYTKVFEFARTSPVVSAIPVTGDIVQNSLQASKSANELVEQLREALTENGYSKEWQKEFERQIEPSVERLNNSVESAERGGFDLSISDAMSEANSQSNRITREVEEAVERVEEFTPAQSASDIPRVTLDLYNWVEDNNPALVDDVSSNFEISTSTGIRSIEPSGVGTRLLDILNGLSNALDVLTVAVEAALSIDVIISTLVARGDVMDIAEVHNQAVENIARKE
jgi:PKD repeat protein